MANLPLKPDYTIDDLPKIGITRYGFIKTTDIVFDPQALKLCASNACRKYGKFWTCSPGSGPLEQSKATCLSYSDALVFCSVYELEDSYDVEGMARGGTEFRNVCDRFYDLLTPPFKLLSTGGCHLCKTCTYPDAPCRFPDRRHLFRPALLRQGLTFFLDFREVLDDLFCLSCQSLSKCLIHPIP